MGEALRTLGVLGALALAASGCADAPNGGAGADSTMPCMGDGDCDDGLFCDGEERCMPAAPAADARGCLHSATMPCSGACDEVADRCADCLDADADGDGVRSTACGGSDCDDTDPERFPGHPEVCDVAGHDEDCDPTTFGVRDSDADGEPDAACCNTASSGTTHCGNDCDDTRASVNPVAVEVCNGRDDDCDTAIDEGVTATFWVDADGDGYGDVVDATGAIACFRPDGYAGTHDDCDDTSGSIHPGAYDACDSGSVDDDCNGTENDPPGGCSCIDGATQACPLSGACAAGTQTCVMGAWSMGCSIAPTDEICNGVDDDCNGVVDDLLRVSCYADGDNDGWAGDGASAATQCPVSGRDSVGGCPPGWTNRAPSGSSIDCDDARSDISPLGIEACSDLSPAPRDEDCDGAIDESVSVLCYTDADEDTYAPSSASSVSRCIDPSRAPVGGCPFGNTNRAPGSIASTDCDDAHVVAHPGAAEVCDPTRIDEDCDGVANPVTLCACANGDTRMCPLPGRCASGTQTCSSGMWSACSVTPIVETCNAMDDDCDGVVDNGVLTTWYADCDRDGYARTGALSTRACAAPISPPMSCTGGSWTSSAPSGTRIDCNDAITDIHPGATESCNGIDDDCSTGGGSLAAEDADGDAHTASGYASCTGGYPRDDCDDTRAAMHPGASEVCNGLDDDCSSGGGALAAEDRDGDMHTSDSYTLCTTGFPQDDCYDTNAAVHPGVTYQSAPYCRMGAPCTTGSGWACGVGSPACTAIFGGATPSWDWNCSGAAEPIARHTGCTCASLQCSLNAFPVVVGYNPTLPVYPSGSPPACGSTVSLQRCSSACSPCATAAAGSGPMPCR